MSVELVIGFAVLLTGLLAAFYLFTVYNSLISLRNNIDKAFANIDVLLKQRSDLIPNLVKTAKAYMKHEKEVLSEITQLRSRVLESKTLSEKADTSDMISRNLKKIFAVSENYPKLLANEHFIELQTQLTKIENRIADRREFYNDSVFLFNTRIHSMPDMIIASVLGYGDKEYFKADGPDRKPVKL